MGLGLVLFLAFCVILPPSIMCGTTVLSENNVNPNFIPSSPSSESNSTHPIVTKNVVKREIQEDFEESQYRIPSEMFPKRSAAGLNKIIYVLRNSFDKPGSPQLEGELGSRESDTFSRDVTQALTRGTGLDRVSCFKKRK